MKVPEQYRITKELAEKYKHVGRVELFISDASYRNEGAFLVPREGKTGAYFFIITSDGKGWEHVSVTIPSEKRCATWEEMCYIKSLFWDNSDCVIQYHPPQKYYVNNHNYCLHMWRPLIKELPIPPSLLVGLKGIKLTNA